MKKKPISKSAFFNPRFLISFAISALCVIAALFAFTHSPGGNARASESEQSQSQVADEAAPPNPADPDQCFLFWNPGPAYPIAVLDNAVTSVGGNLYSFAGVSTTIVTNAYKFDGTTWTPIAPMPAALEYPAATTDGTDIYLLGGALTGTGTPQNTLYKYNVAANTYTPLAPFTTGTWNNAAVFLNGKIYKFAGTGPATASTNVLEIYDVASNTWSVGAPYPLSISFVSAIAQGNFIYGAGGIQSVGSAPSSKTFRYDPVNNTWDDAAIADLPDTRWGAASGFLNGGWVMAGGYVAGAATTNISTTAVSWDPGTNVWSTLPSKLGERSRMNGAVLGGTFYVIGGRSMASAAFVGTNDNQALICSSTTPTPSPTPCPAVFSDNFDGVTAPALPPGWVATNVAGSDPALWVTSTTTPDTAPNEAFVNDPATVNDKVLDTPGIFVGSASATISFRNFFNTESTFDGCVLEVSSPNIGGGAFTDITNVAVGGSFVTGGYNGPISTAFMSPIAGRQAWSGTSGNYINTVANLGPNVAGQTIKLRFRMASDSSVSATGWRVDGVAVRACSSGPTPTPCVGCTPTPPPSTTPTPTPPVGPTPTPCSGSTSEGFTDITTLVPGGWFMQNNSQPGPGLTGWFQGNTAVFNAQAGAPTSYIGTNFNNGTGTSTLSNWLLTPPLTLQNGVVLSFWTRTVDTPTFPDRLQVRMSTNGASTNVGSTATSVGDFTTVLLDINPTYTTSGYPNVWTQFTVTLSGIASPTSGRLALRYFVENGGPSGVNSDFIGIDTLTITGSCGPTPTPCVGCTPTPTPVATPTPTPPGPTPTPGCGVNENFDGVTAPALPAGWVAANAAGAAPLWVTSSTTPDSAPNAAFIDDPAVVSDKRLDTPNISITGAAQITFRNNFALEPVGGGTSFFDGGVLEVSSPNIAGGAFTDITNAAVGGSFVTGGYTGTISTAFSSPIGGRMAWSQSSAGYITTTANLGPNVVGQTIKLRFRMCSDSSVSGTGWRIDNVVVTGGPCVTPTPCVGCTPTPTPVVTPTATPPVGPTPTPCSGSQSEGFTDITTLVPGGWFMQNNSQPGPGLTGWFQGNTAVFDAQAGAPTSYIGTNFNNGTGTSTLSNWLLTPPLTLQNGVVLSFWTRTTDTPTFPDRLQVRMSTNGASTNVGSTATSVGDFTTVLLDINPTYTTSGYPNVWTQFTVTLSGIASPTSGRLAMRYFVENGGPSGVNSDFIGIDTLTITGACGSGTPTPTPPVVVTPTPTPPVGETPTPTPPVGETPTPTPPVGETPTPTPPIGQTPTPTPIVGETHALNLSTRLQVGTDSNVGIGGFIVTGTGDRNVLLRGIGPSLPSGINSLPDPVLELHGENGFVTVINNNWRDNQEQAIIDTGIPPTNDLESAILVMLPPGAYTAILKGNGTTNNTGVGLVEVYDLTQGGSSKLGNISTRGIVQTGNEVMIAGFILGAGNTNDPIIVRGIGPSLADFGVPGVLADPTLELRDENGALVNSNNDWMDDPDQVALINAAGLAPTNALEAAIAATLVPGSYTAVLAGNGGGTGTGLVEMYDHPTAGPTPPPGTPTPTPPIGPTATPPIGPTATPEPATPTPGVTVCTENFDGVTAPALPAGWVASNPTAGDGVLFVTTTNASDSAPNNAFIPDQDGISDKVLDRQMTINSDSPMLTFRNNFNSEFSDGVFWDGGVLEISAPNISSGDFLDFTDSHVGGSCTSGCYTGELSGDASNPLAGRMAWSGNSGGYIDTVINLGPNLIGQTITLRFRFGSDEAAAATGWHIDGLSINGASCP